MFHQRQRARVSVPHVKNRVLLDLKEDLLTRHSGPLPDGAAAEIRWIRADSAALDRVFLDSTRLDLTRLSLSLSLLRWTKGDGMGPGEGFPLIRSLYAKPVKIRAEANCSNCLLHGRWSRDPYDFYADDRRWGESHASPID